MPAFQLRIHCKCGHDFLAVVRPRGDDPPDKRYTVICPMNASRYTFRLCDVRKKWWELPGDAVEARQAVSAPSITAEEWRPEPSLPWYTQPPYPALLFAAALSVLGLLAWGGLAVLKEWR